MKIKGSAFEFFETIPDELLIKIAINDWESLEKLCLALTVDIQLLKEELSRNLN